MYEKSRFFAVFQFDIFELKKSVLENMEPMSVTCETSQFRKSPLNFVASLKASPMLTTEETSQVLKLAISKAPAFRNIERMSVAEETSQFVTS